MFRRRGPSGLIADKLLPMAPSGELSNFSNIALAAGIQLRHRGLRGADTVRFILGLSELVGIT